MRRWSLARMVLTLAGSTLLWAALGAVCLLVGSTGEVGWPAGEVLRYRVEVVLLASLIGAALAAAGVVYQAILRNPLADPYLLGASSGAALFGYLWQFALTYAIVGKIVGDNAAAISQQGFGFIGAAVSVAVVLLLASRRGRLEPITLLLVGVIVNAVNASIFLLINAVVREQPGSGGPVAFLVGGINPSITSQQKWTATAIIGAGWVVLMYLAGQLNVAVLGEGEAEALGVRIQRLRWVGLVVASIVTASAVAISGPIGFVGLVCPHLGRMIVGSDVRKLLPVATGMGAGLLAVADAASRYLAGTSAQTSLPVGVLTGLLGGPFFLLILWQSRRRGGLEGVR